MTKLNKELKAQALEALKGNWKAAVLMYLIYVGISGLSNTVPVLQLAVSLFVLPMMGYGMCAAYLNLFNGGRLNVEQIFDGFYLYNRVLLCSLIQFGKVLLWCLLFIIPGIIKSLAYSMSYFILKEEPELSPSQAIKKSEEMMHGHKMRLFLLNLSFIGWVILGCITIIGIFWVFPYVLATMTAFYNDLKENYKPQL